MSMPVRVKKWGDNMAVLIPSQLAKRRRISVGSIIDIEPVRGVRDKEQRHRLSELMVGFKPRHRHGEWELGERVGREVW